MARPRQKTALRVTFAEALRGWRTHREMTQQALAESAGLTQDFVGSLETGRREPSFATLDRLAAALSIEPWRLLKGAP